MTFKLLAKIIKKSDFFINFVSQKISKTCEYILP